MASSKEWIDSFSSGLHTVGWLAVFAGGLGGCGQGFSLSGNRDIGPWLVGVGTGSLTGLPWAAGFFAGGLFLTILGRWLASRGSGGDPGAPPPPG